MREMIREVIVAVDLEGTAEQQVLAKRLTKLGVMLAHWTDSQLRLFSATEENDPEHREKERRLNALAEAASSQARCTVWLGSSINELLKLKRRGGVVAELLVAGLRGHGRTELALHGSVSEALLQHTSRPVVLLGPAFQDFQESKPLLYVATDLTNESRAAEWYARSLAKRLKTGIKLFHSLWPTIRSLEEGIALAGSVTEEQRVDLEEALSDAEKRIRAKAEWIERSGVSCDWRIDVSRESLADILARENISQPALLFMGGGNRGPMMTRLLGSTVRDVAMKSSIPIVAVHRSKSC